MATVVAMGGLWVMLLVGLWEIRLRYMPEETALCNDKKMFRGDNYEFYTSWTEILCSFVFH